MAITYLDDEPKTPAPAPSSGGITYLDDEPSLGGFLKNAGQNALDVLNPKNLLMGAAHTVKDTAVDLPKDIMNSALQTTADVVTGKDSGQTPMGKRFQDVAQSEEVQNPKQWAYEHPVDAALQASTIFAPMAPELGAAREDAALRASRFAQEHAVKSLEGAIGQVRQLGPEEARAVGQKALDEGIVSPFTPTNLGMERKLQAFGERAGSAVGAGRAAGDLAGGAPDINLLKNNAEATLTPEYGTGMRSGQMGSLQNAIDEIGKIKDPTFSGIANKATEMNQFAAKNKLLQPEGPITDVANFLSKANNEALQKTLTPQQWADYQAALNDYSTFSKISKFFERGEARSMAGRGTGLTTDLYKGVKDVIGHKALAAGADVVAKTLSSPAVAKAMPILQKAAQAGPAALETAHYMLQKNDPEYAAATQGTPGKEPSAADQGPDQILSHAMTDPELGKWRGTFEEAAQRGPQAIIANHFTLMQRDPEYNKSYMNHHLVPNR